LNTIQQFHHYWEVQEQASLAADRDDKIKYLQSDRQAEADANTMAMEEIDKKAENAVLARHEWN
jgi:hypothetical protein